MRQIILHVATTVDRFIEGPDGEMDWLVRDETIDFADILTEILSDKDMIFYGRESYDKWGNAGPWPGASQKLKDAYRLMHNKTKYVFSRTKTGDGTNAIFINSNIKETVLEIKQQPGKNIWLYGGARILSTFINLDLVDEYRLAVHPVLLGKGKLLFENIEEMRKLILVEVKGHKSGIVLETYRTDKKG